MVGMPVSPFSPNTAAVCLQTVRSCTLRAGPIDGNCFLEPSWTELVAQKEWEVKQHHTHVIAFIPQLFQRLELFLT